ncbi:MAG: hypothetical protein MJK04_13365, partial [Psychrosphaera sp.]|nr:hypothetical protein [Psychrosphaera sp.]
MMPWLYLHFPSLQLDALKQNSGLGNDSGSDLDLDLNNDFNDSRPLIVVEPRQNAVQQLNLAAQSEGITLGMGLATAISLSGELVVVEYNRALETSRLQELAQWLYQVAADIAEAIVAEGHSEVAFIIVGSGPHGADPHHECSDRELQ